MPTSDAIDNVVLSADAQLARGAAEKSTKPTLWDVSPDIGKKKKAAPKVVPEEGAAPLGARSRLEQERLAASPTKALVRSWTG